MKSNFTSCQKESDELLHEDFTKSKSPDILNFTQARMSPPPFIHFHFIQIIFTGLHFELAQEKGGGGGG